MKLTGITATTGTHALGVVINYDNKLPHVRINKKKEEHVDDILILGRKVFDHSFHILAQIHIDQITPIKQVHKKAGSIATAAVINPCHLVEQSGKDLASFAAYIHG